MVARASTEGTPARRHATAVAALLIVLGAIKLAASVVAPILLGLFLALALGSLRAAFAARVPRHAATALTVLACTAALGAFGSVLATAGASLVAGLPERVEELARAQRETAEWLADHHLRGLAAAVRRYEIGGDLAGQAAGTVRALWVTLGTAVVVLLIAGFALAEEDTLRRKMAHLEAREGWDLEPLRGAARDVSDYLRVKTVVSLMTGVGASAVCAILGFETALAMGLVAFVLNYVPMVGSLVAAIPAIVLAALGHGWLAALLVALGYGAINLVFGNILEPRWLGGAADLSPLVVILALAVWGYLLGATGAFLSVPLTQIACLFCRRTESLAWVAVLLQKDAPQDRRARASPEPSRHPAPERVESRA